MHREEDYQYLRDEVYEEICELLDERLPCGNCRASILLHLLDDAFSGLEEANAVADVVSVMLRIVNERTRNDMYLFDVKGHA